MLRSSHAVRRLNLVSTSNITSAFDQKVQRCRPRRYLKKKKEEKPLKKKKTLRDQKPTDWGASKGAFTLCELIISSYDTHTLIEMKRRCVVSSLHSLNIVRWRNARGCALRRDESLSRRRTLEPASIKKKTALVRHSFLEEIPNLDCNQIESRISKFQATYPIVFSGGEEK